MSDICEPCPRVCLVSGVEALLSALEARDRPRVRPEASSELARPRPFAVLLAGGLAGGLTAVKLIGKTQRRRYRCLLGGCDEVRQRASLGRSWTSEEDVLLLGNPGKGSPEQSAVLAQSVSVFVGPLSAICIIRTLTARTHDRTSENSSNKMR